MEKINVEHMLAIEEPFMKAPVEQLKRAVRQSQKQAEREAAQVSAALDGMAGSSSSSELGPEEMDKALGGLIDRLKTLKRKLEEAQHEEAQLIQRSKQRATDLSELDRF
ncbi:GID complex subunit containing RING finger motif, partial [Coemansia nantahalensis]